MTWRIYIERPPNLPWFDLKNKPDKLQTPLCFRNNLLFLMYASKSMSTSQEAHAINWFEGEKKRKRYATNWTISPYQPDTPYEGSGCYTQLEKPSTHHPYIQVHKHAPYEDIT